MLYCVIIKLMTSGIYNRSNKTRISLSISHKRKWMSEEYRKKQSEAHKGQIPTNLELIHKNNKGKNNKMWKGNNVGYRALHDWVRKWKGKPKECENCGNNMKRLSWANIDHKYTRDLNKYIALCDKCHWYYDVEHKLRAFFAKPKHTSLQD